MSFHCGDTETHAKLQALYLSWVNDYLTVEKFAEDHSITTDEAESIIKLGREAHEGIVQRHKDERYDVVHSFMGTGMHNYQVHYNGTCIAYRTTEDSAWAACEEHHIMELTLRTFDNRG